jgi:hypothetical protein
MLTGHVDILSRREIHGWAVDTEALDAAVGVIITIDGCFHGKTEASVRRDHGFVWHFDPELSKGIACTVAVYFESSGELIADGRQRFYPQQAAIAHAGLLPVLVTSFGRSGSSLLMHRLSRQPEIIIPGGFPYETRLATYYANAYRLLTEYDDDAEVADPNRLGRATSLGSIPFLDAIARYPAFFRGHAHGVLAACFGRLSTAFYQEAATIEQRGAARMFAEKCDFAEDSRAILYALFPDLREIVLVRDLRDLYCSSRAFWHLDDESALLRLRRVRDMMLGLYHDTQPRMMLLRYEDLVLDPVGTGRRVADFLDLAAPFEIDLPGEAKMFATHATTANPRSSIGRWARETLPPAIKTLIAESDAFDKAFRYQQSGYWTQGAGDQCG